MAEKQDQKNQRREEQDSRYLGALEPHRFNWSGETL
jgi:hypothetical protein